MRLWHWIVGMFFGTAPETEIYGREALRKPNLDETAREVARLPDRDMALLEAMRRTRSGWSEQDLDRLYRSFGFREITRPRAPHRVYIHPDHPQLRATVGRHRSLAKGYATTAIRLIDTLLAIESSADLE